jgi:hypothetical protein
MFGILREMQLAAHRSHTRIGEILDEGPERGTLIELAGVAQHHDVPAATRENVVEDGRLPAPGRERHDGDTAALKRGGYHDGRIVRSIGRHDDLQAVRGIVELETVFELASQVAGLVIGGDHEADGRRDVRTSNALRTQDGEQRDENRISSVSERHHSRADPEGILTHSVAPGPWTHQTGAAGSD